MLKGMLPIGYILGGVILRDFIFFQRDLRLIPRSFAALPFCPLTACRTLRRWSLSACRRASFKARVFLSSVLIEGIAIYLSSGGSSSKEILPFLLKVTAPWTMFSSSRTFPGQSYSIRMRYTSGSKPEIPLPALWAYLWRKCSARGIMSSFRSLKGGMSMVTTLRR